MKVTKTKYPTKQIALICQCCKKDFFYSAKEFRRQTTKFHRLSDSFYCSRSCALKWRNQNEVGFRGEMTQEAKIKFAKIGKEQALKRSKGPFHYYVRMIWKRSNSSTITHEDIQTIWEQSKGLCPISGVKMVLKTAKSKPSPFSASIDRIDSSKDYEIGNIQFVAYSANLAKSAFSQEEISGFFLESRSQLLH